MERRWYWLAFGMLVIGVVTLSIGIFFLFKATPLCDFTYVNQDFACGGKPVIKKAGYAALENDLTAYIAQQVEKGSVDEVAVYFRDLRSGPTFGIEEDETFSPASLLKLPLIITYFSSMEEEAPDLLATNVIFREPSIEDNEQLIQMEGPGIRLVDGQSYTIEELMYNTIVYSDNASYQTLVRLLNDYIEGGSERILRTFQELGIIDPRDLNEEVVSVHGYATIFRVLYNASYLSPEASEKLLSWMAEATYVKGIKAGVPKEVRVADKFGERWIDDETKQLHDCGIVFYPENPYTLCIMTRGNDYGALTETISEISRRVYKEVDSRRL